MTVDPAGDASQRFPELSPGLLGKQILFRAPALTAEFCAAIKLITPHFDLAPDEVSRQFWEMDQNGSCWGEYGALEPLLTSMPRPRKVLEIGPGFGRSTVFFKRKLNWEDVDFHLYEGAGTSVDYHRLGPRDDNSFCGNLKWLRNCLDHNRVEHAELYDARALGGRLSRLPGPYDLIYGFYSIGFHWALEHFLDEIASLMHDRTVAVFTVPSSFEVFEALKEYDFRVLTWTAVWPKDRELRMLVFSKTELPGI